MIELAAIPEQLQSEDIRAAAMYAPTVSQIQYQHFIYHGSYHARLTGLGDVLQRTHCGSLSKRKGKASCHEPHAPGRHTLTMYDRSAQSASFGARASSCLTASLHAATSPTNFAFGPPRVRTIADNAYCPIKHMHSAPLHAPAPHSPV